MGHNESYAVSHCLSDSVHATISHHQSSSEHSCMPPSVIISHHTPSLHIVTTNTLTPLYLSLFVCRDRRYALQE